MTASPERLLRVPSAAALRVEPLGLGCVVFDTGTCNTHYLHEPASSGFYALLSGPTTASHVRSRIADAFSVADDDELNTYVESMLNHFMALGLVE